MKKIFFSIILFLFIKNVHAQFYYNDVVSLKESNRIYQTVIKNNIHSISATSVESDNTTTKGFSYDREIKNNGALIITNTTLEATGDVATYEYYRGSRLSQSVDSTSNVMTKVQYNYDGSGNIQTIETQTDDTSRNMHSVELHKWFYSLNNPDSMLRIKDNADTTVVHFKKDEKQNIIEELWMKKNRLIEHYFYYYNDKSQLTDIVRFNTRAQQMLPDFLFDYNEGGIVSQLTQIPQGSSDYVIWQYVYDDNGLKSKDVLFDKHQQLIGTVTYDYK